MKKLLLISLILTSFLFAYSFRSILVGNGGTKDTILAAAACTVNLSRSLNGVQKINMAWWVDTIGNAGSNLKAKLQVSPDNSKWLDLHAALFGDSTTGEDLALKIDTVAFNIAATMGYANAGCFRYTRIITQGIYSNQKSVLYLYLQCWY